MKSAAIPLSVAFNVAGGIAFAQGADDPMEHLRACSVMEGAARLERLEDYHVRLRRRLPPGGDN
jgi:hypothetical protein